VRVKRGRIDWAGRLDRIGQIGQKMKKKKKKGLEEERR
jgi:hypothetical protein